MNLICKLSIVISTFFLVACQNDPSSQAEIGSVEFINKSKTNPDIQGLNHAPWVEPWNGNFDKRLNSFDVDCEGDNCPASIATFISIKELPEGKSSYGVCGGTLQDKNHILTARHCVDAKVLTKGASCSNSGYFLFPATPDHPAASARCAQVVDFAEVHENMEESLRQPDWVLLKIDRSFPDRVTPINLNGLTPGEGVFFFKPMYDRENKIVKIRRYSKCKNIQGSHFLPSADNNFSPMTLIHCSRLFSPGYSGFGFFNKDGELVATESHSVENEFNGQEHSHYAVASNLACTLPSDDPKIRKKCRWNPEKQAHLHRRLFAKKVRASKNKNHQTFFDWLENRQKSPLKWEKVELENLQSTPPAFRSFFEDFSNIQNFQGDPSEIEKHKSAAAIMTPGYPTCIKPQNLTGAITAVTIPVVYLLVVENEHAQPTVSTEIIEAQGSVSEIPGSPDRFSVSLSNAISYPAVPKLENGSSPMVKYQAANFPSEPFEIPLCP